MSRTVRWMVAVAALVMSAAYVLPLWRVSLIAPQYPEGLGMLIRVNTVDGFKEGDLQSINGLNHYIGMKRIEPDAIPELKFMPFILAVLIVSGLGVAALGKRKVFVGWAFGLAAVLAAGLADYWKWGYEYGHDLSSTAIIKIPGMTYQPPLIGSKKLLNFTATSWPALGGWLLIAAAIAVAAALYMTLFRHRRRGMAAAALSMAASTACAVGGPRPFKLNEEACDFCRMTIVDARYGGEAITTKGTVYTFDSIECLAGFVRRAPRNMLRSIYVVDLQHPGTFVDVQQAGFLTDIMIKSPMGKSVAGFVSPAAAEEQRAMLGGHVSRWADVLADTAAVAHSS